MFQYLNEHTEELVAIRVTGKLDQHDYASLIPEFENKIRQYGKINLYWEMVDFTGWQPEGLLEDLQFDARHADDYKKIAMVGDERWEEWMTKLMKPFSSAEIKYFDLLEREQALSWIQEKRL
ncbi:STAS/SEC14 domain-containing protein [Hymenobacter defluvii]|uniref:STAS/SEC14 domain-containing protein n=1 Tax=Hymenobacter defluvii TaxID=2054411 RepID=A0ABS3TEG8_9BACT|nr:STAS/SEC14 domain-containing protein [Hymenobacter defluvii]MBO3272050.1 STAS/SEC14 domain-containing protein [Hymenobacter defluvii]